VLRGKIEKNNKEMEEKVAEQKQLRDMEKRIKKLEMENDLLKKAYGLLQNATRRLRLHKRTSKQEHTNYVYCFWCVS